MGLFSDEKKYFFGIDVNHAKMPFEDFRVALIEFFESDTCINYLKEHNCSVDISAGMQEVLMTGCSQSYLLQATMPPFGDFRVTFFEKGQNQGLAFVSYTVRMFINLKKTDKKWITDFYKLIFDFYEAKFNSGDEKHPLFICYFKE